MVTRNILCVQGPADRGRGMAGGDVYCLLLLCLNCLYIIWGGGGGGVCLVGFFPGGGGGVGGLLLLLFLDLCTDTCMFISLVRPDV